jgi:hypothetical protein
LSDYFGNGGSFGTAVFVCLMKKCGVKPAHPDGRFADEDEAAAAAMALVAGVLG